MDQTTLKFLHEVEDFLARHNMTGARLGKLALNDTRFVDRLRDGASPRLVSADRIREFMRNYKPRPSKRLQQGAAA